MITSVICCIAKNENKYIKEWVDYHLSLGFNHIFIYDNNDIDGEHISDIINNTNVTIVNYRGKKYVQQWAYTNCFKENNSKYTWFVFIDCDEFIELNGFNTINEFLAQSIFDNENIIRLHWKHYSDNNILSVKDNNYNVLSRFKYDGFNTTSDKAGKSIIKNTLNLHNKTITAHGFCNSLNIRAVNCLGEVCSNTEYIIDYNKTVYGTAWINHYPTKTIEEYINQKYFRGDASTPTSDKNRYNTLDYFWRYNKYTKEKEDYGKYLIEKISTSNDDFIYF